MSMHPPIAPFVGPARLTMEDLREMLPRWDLISYPEAQSRGVAVLAHSAENEGARPELCLVVAASSGRAAETWALRQLSKSGVMPARIQVTALDDLNAYLARHENQLRAMDDVLLDPNASGPDDVAAIISLGRLQQEASPVVKLVNSTLYDALKLNASDIHLECDTSGMRVSYRLDGVLVPMTDVGGIELAEQVISRVKVMSELDIAERRIPQDGRFKVRINDREIDFRVSIMPSSFGEDAVLRLLDRQALTEAASGLTLESLGLDVHIMAGMRRLAQKPHGMLLVTGPTGSGKTTTLYAAISEINTGRDKIITIEDPVEYRLPRVLQIPVNEKKGLTFARGLRSILRHDPDKIMVGEIRDGDTAQIAIQAALTGHLVLTTLHANNVFDVLGRFLHMGVDAYSLSAALNGVVAQRLLRTTCIHCSIPRTPQREHLESLNLIDSDISSWSLMAGQGCGHCRGTGYRGRHAVAEVLMLTDTLREMIAARASVASMKEEAMRTGWRSLRDSAIASARAGRTTLDEVLRVAG